MNSPTARWSPDRQIYPAAFHSWLSSGLEGLWLLTVLLVPLVVIRQDYVWATFIEGPKVALLRALAALMLSLWLVEFATNGSPPPRHINDIPRWLVTRWPSARNLLGSLARPSTGWIIILVGLVLTTSLVSALLSPSPGVSFWGRVPGLDGYSVYNLISMAVVFAVIATHLRHQSQFNRLFRVISAGGGLVGAYAISQAYGHDFLHMMEGGNRATSTLGNPVFAASLLLITTLVSLVALSLSTRGPITRASYWLKQLVWVPLLSVQVLGLIFTYSRGPWVGFTVAAVLFLVGTLIFAGRSTFARLASSLGLTTLVVGIVLLWLGPSGMAIGNSSANQFFDRVQSIGDDTLDDGSFQVRLRIWESSFRLIRDRPGFPPGQSPDSSFNRQVFGYGPEFFQYVYLTESRPVPPSWLPQEPSHAHNLVVHQAVELGILGLLAWPALLLAPIIVGSYGLLRGRNHLPLEHRVLIAGLVSIFAGRLIEQSVGVAKVSDLTLYWVLLAAFVAASYLPILEIPGPRSANTGGTSWYRRSLGPRQHDSARGAAWWTIVQLMIALWLVGGLAALTWTRAVNYPRAAWLVGQARESIQKSDWQNGLESIEKATEIAPDVPQYRLFNAQARLAYLGENKGDELGICKFVGIEQRDDLCRARISYLGSAAAFEQRPQYYLYMLQLANSSIDLGIISDDHRLSRQAIQLYRQAAEAVPSDWSIRNQLAVALIRLGDPKAALVELERSLAITEGPNKGTNNSATAIMLKGLAFGDLDLVDDAVKSLRVGLELALPAGTAINETPPGNNFNPKIVKMSLQELIGLERDLGYQQGAVQKGKLLLVLSQRDGDQEFEGVAWRELGLIAVESGRKREGIKLMALGILGQASLNHSDVAAQGEFLGRYLTQMNYTDADVESLFTEATKAYEEDHGWGLLQEIFDDR